MTPSKALFRSHLMQQFAAAARHQSRPPLALAAASSSSGKRRSSSTTSASSHFTSSSAPRGTSSILPASHASASTATHITATPARSKSTVVERSEEDAGVHHDLLAVDKDTVEDTVNPLASSFQSLMTTRRTQSKFHLVEDTQQQSHLKLALDRAIVCAQAAPNHHKTEPFFFKRLMAPSASTQELSHIASQVVLQKKQRKDPEHAQAHADRKFQKWCQIPAFLVTLVQDNQEPQSLSTDALYEPMEYMPPTTERQLEDVCMELLFLCCLLLWKGGLVVAKGCTRTTRDVVHLRHSLINLLLTLLFSSSTLRHVRQFKIYFYHCMPKV